MAKKSADREEGSKEAFKITIEFWSIHKKDVLSCFRFNELNTIVRAIEWIVSSLVFTLFVDYIAMSIVWQKGVPGCAFFI